MTSNFGAFLGFAAVIGLAFAWLGVVELRRRLRRASRIIDSFSQPSHVRVIDLDVERSARHHPAGRRTG